MTTAERRQRVRCAFLITKLRPIKMFSLTSGECYDHVPFEKLTPEELQFLERVFKRYFPTNPLTI